MKNSNQSQSVENLQQKINLQNQSISSLKHSVETLTKEVNLKPDSAFKLPSDSSNLKNIDPPNNNSTPQNRIMNIEPKDVIMAIPVFSGDQKELDTFLNTCDLYNSLVPNEQKANLLLIIKAKIRGEALTKISPFDDCNTWDDLKKRIRERIRKPVTLEFAQEDLSKVSQGTGESMNDYGKRVRNKLLKLNEASRQIANTAAERAILQKANERLAISKFEQNIRDNTVRVLVSATKNESLDDAIQMALQKELMEKIKNVAPMKCTHCGMSNHTVESCRKKQNSNQNKNNFGNNKSFNRNFVRNENKNEPK